MLSKDCDFMDEVYSHIDDDTGQVRHFNATKMALAAADAVANGNARLITAAMDSEFVEFIKECRGIEPWKLERLTAVQLAIPVIGVEMGDSVLTVDGHHRLVCLEELGHETYEIYVFKEGAWDEFLVTDIPDELEEHIVDVVKEQRIILLS